MPPSPKPPPGGRTARRLGRSLTWLQLVGLVIAGPLVVLTAIWVLVPGRVVVTQEIGFARRLDIARSEGIDVDDVPSSQEVRSDCPLAPFDGGDPLRRARGAGGLDERGQALIDARDEACATARRGRIGPGAGTIAAALLVGAGLVIAGRGRGRRLYGTIPWGLGADGWNVGWIPAAPARTASSRPCARCHARLADATVGRGSLPARPGRCDRCRANAGQWATAAVLVAAFGLLGTGLVVLDGLGDPGSAPFLLTIGVLPFVLLLHVVVHEAGHVAGAILVRARVLGVQLGFGPTYRSTRWFGCRVGVGAHPFDGLTMVAVPSRRAHRLRRWVLIAAGPLTTAALVAAALAWEPTSEVARAWRDAVAASGALILVVNLLPIRIGQGHVQPTDGLQLIQIPFRSSAWAAEEAALARGVCYADDAVTAGSLARIPPLPAADLADLDDRVTAGDLGALLVTANAAVGREQWDLAADRFRRAATADQLPLGSLVLVLAVLGSSSSAASGAGAIEVGGEADRATADAHALDPEDASVALIRGLVLARLGETEAARRLADRSYDDRPNAAQELEVEAARWLVRAAAARVDGDLATSEEALGRAIAAGASDSSVSSIRAVAPGAIAAAPAIPGGDATAVAAGAGSHRPS